MKLMIGGATAFLMLGSLAVRCEEWTVETGQGMAVIGVQHGPGNKFEIVCDEGFSEKEGTKTELSIEIGGQRPRPLTHVNVILDNETISFFAGRDGVIELDCRVCSNKFDLLWTTLRKAKFLNAEFEGGLNTPFDLKKARGALATKKPCATPFTALLQPDKR